MNRKRVSYLLLFAVALVVGLGLFLYLDRGSSRQGRGRAAEGRAAGGVEGNAAVREARRARETFADAAALKALIEKYGGFATRGRVLLTRPEGPGAKLDVRLRGRVDDTPVEAAGWTDASGAFSLPQLPREGEYSLQIIGARVQQWRREAIEAPAEGVLDLGELVLRRYYFLKGRVLGEGRDIEGAEVALMDTPGSGFSFFQAGMQADVDDPVLARSEVDERGRFVLKFVRPGIFTVRARAVGWAPQYRGDIVVGGVVDTEVTLALARGYEVVGYVLDGAGRPIADAGVALFAMSRRSFNWSKELSRTDGTGRFGFIVEPRATEYTISATLKGSLNLSKQFRVPLEENLVLQLPGQGVLTGRVLNARTKQPVPGAEVLLGLARTAQRGFGMPEFGKALRTDAFGAFRIEGVGPGRVQSLTVRAGAFADLRLGAFMASDPELWKQMQTIELDGAGETELPDLELQSGRTLVGVVSEKGGSAAVAGATVELWDFFMGNRTTETAADGSYRFDGVGDRVSMIVSKTGYAPFREPPFPGFQLPEGKSVTRDFALEQGGTVRGKVTTAGGAPVARALVRLRPAATGWSSWTVALSLRDAWTYTDEDGRYVLSGVAVAKVYAAAEAPGFDSGRSKQKQVQAGAELKQLDITMLPAARLAGRVVTRDDSAVRSARITVARDPGADADGGAQWRALAEGEVAFSDAQGRFTVPAIPTGDLLLRIEAVGFATSTQRLEGVKPGAEISKARLELAPAFVIAGRIVDPNGRPFARGWIRARHTASPDGEPVAQLLGARLYEGGHFALRNLPAGTYTVEVRVGNFGGGPRYENLTVEGVAAGAKNLVFKLKLAEQPVR
ncbi:MAG: carboxypeptidase regulatory-like domain-containing protein [Planctomycetota bacterium]|jgi:hypothetical protein